MLDEFFGNRFYRNHREKLLMILDLIMVVFSYLFSYWVKGNFAFRVFQSIELGNAILFMVLVCIVYSLSFLIFKVYKSLWKYISISEVFSLSKANVLATLIILIATLVFRNIPSLLSLELIAGILALLFMFSFRSLYRIYRGYRIKKISPSGRNAIIIGAGDGGNLLLKELIQNPKLEYNVLGFVDDQKKDIIISGLPILGTSQELSRIKQNYKIEVAMIAIPSATREELIHLVEACKKENLEVKMINMRDVLGNRTSAVHDVRIEDLLGRGEVRLEQGEIRSYIENKVVAVTGAGGSIGSELCRQILRFHPKRLVMIDVNENALYMLEQEFNRNRMHGSLHMDIEIVSLVASIRDKEAIDKLMKKEHPHVVYHAAAHKHVPLMERRPSEAIKNNVFGTNNVIHACIENKVDRFIMISTDKAVNPTNVMGATKRMTELILQANGKNGVTKMAAVRFGNVLGSNGSVIPIFKKQIEEGGPITITDKKITRYFMTIPEASQLVLQAGYYAHEGDIFVLDMGEPVKILDLAENLIRLSGFIPYKDIDIKEIGLRPGEKMYEELSLEDEETIPTKNGMISRNKHKDIQLDKLDVVLANLYTLIHSNVDKAEIKAQLLDCIHRELEEQDV